VSRFGSATPFRANSHAQAGQFAMQDHVVLRGQEIVMQRRRFPFHLPVL